ncbi:MAG: PDZ domain-containing protein, partial [Acidobacteriota bacterium]|nr:PDZ domain-containing protein [Acidobacteriota bacterium]
NIRGEVIGVNTMIATQSGGYQGIGFALPMNMVARVYNDIIKTGKVTRGSIGITWNKANKPDLLRALGTKQGVMVEAVKKGGPAERAGIKDEDIITAINGQPVKDGEELVGRVAEMPIGSATTITVDRNGKRMDFKVTIEDRSVVFKEDLAGLRQPPEEEPGKVEGASQAKFGMKIKALTDGERETLDLKDKHGVQVVSVDQGSFAEDVGITEKDVIVSINRQPVSSVEDVRKIQAGLKPGDAVAFRMMRANPFGTRSQRGPGWSSFFVSGTLPPE